MFPVAVGSPDAHGSALASRAHHAVVASSTLLWMAVGRFTRRACQQHGCHAIVVTQTLLVNAARG